ncbi:ABC-2 type transport system ATP-binding protein [Thermasporomyces composti]|uniref:ABC-2 type transport system ATP-binding protein n=2 Tax=Thermasporomyces composti TaxID=696763 RepID=A0A3D9V9G2_THECX|nr:ATP-binding cassette domain-containing protein [Thermasporomyces composti]REF38157.1 ABC-2 type transport system ATP-binding protein [Thermasporomyces composti]
MLELRGVTKRYGDRVAVDNLSMSVRPGQMFGFVGTNGAGKTTTMRILMGVLQQDAGVVLWEGRPAGPADRRRFGYMPEERGLYPKMRVKDQLVYLARLRGVPAAEAAASADRLLAEFGLAERARDRVDELSLGNQQRVQLAAALVHDPTFLVLDEPFSGLDPVGVDALAHSLQERVRRGVGVLFSSHQLDLVERLCDAVGIIRAGKIIASGSVEDLRSRGRPRTYRVVVGARPGWAAGLTGVRVVRDETENGDVARLDGAGALRSGDPWTTVTILELADGVDDQLVLDAARTAGPVREFRRVTPTLTELFREAVSQPSSPATVTPSEVHA